GVLGHPDLRTDYEVIRVVGERLAPERERLVTLPAGMEGGAAREQLKRLRGHRRTVGRRLGGLAREKALEVPAHPRVPDVEVVEVLVADGPGVVDERTARHDSEAERRAQRASGVDQHRELDS